MNELLDQILVKMKSVDGIKAWTKGNVSNAGIDRMTLPHLFVYGVNTNLQRKTTCSDIGVYTVNIRIVDDLMAGVRETGNADEKLLFQHNIIEKFEGISNGTYKSDSVVGILQSNLQDDTYHHTGEWEITYPQTNSQGTFPYVEGILTATFTNIINRI